ncbi:MAG: TonB family protein [bacterium]
MRSLRWLRPYRWPLLVSILLHVGFLLLLIGTQPASGSNRRTTVPLLSLNSIPELGKSQPKRPPSKEQSKEKTKAKESKKSTVKETKEDKKDPKPTPPNPQDNSLAKATKQMEEILDKPQNSEPQPATERLSEEKPDTTKPSVQPSLTELPVQKQSNKSSSPATTKKSTKIVARSGSNLLENNKKLAAIISSASQLPAKAPPVTSLPKRIETNLFELLAGTELVPIGAPTLMSAMQAVPTSEQLSDQEALAYSEQINNVILALWDVPFHLVDSNLTVVVRFTVQPNGKVMKYRVEDLSGNKALDNSVLTLIRDLRMFPPLPDSYTLPIYEFGVRFSPKQFQF